MLHFFRLFRIDNMLENWHQMVGNWLETINIYKYMNIYNACMRLLPFLWFSMKLGVINSFLIVCFYNGSKNYSNRRIFTKLVHKYYVNGNKTTFMEKCIKFTINIRENFTNYFSHNSID